MLILDTDLLTLVQRGSGEEYRRLSRRLEAAAADHEVCVTIISFEEQVRGWLAQIAAARTSDKQERAYLRLHNLLRDYLNRRVLDYSGRAIHRYQQLVKAWVRIGTMDLKIAAITLAHGATLLSRNLRDFTKVTGLQVEDWTTSLSNPSHHSPHRCTVSASGVVEKTTRRPLSGQYWENVRGRPGPPGEASDMATSPMHRALQRLRRAALAPGRFGPTDGQLLEGFIVRRDEAAFEALLTRHGPMVLGVCRRVLGHAPDADDAFQATFLVLVRTARSEERRVGT